MPRMIGEPYARNTLEENRLNAIFVRNVLPCDALVSALRAEHSMLV